jgi:hypothetical protein
MTDKLKEELKYDLETLVFEGIGNNDNMLEYLLDNLKEDTLHDLLKTIRELE